MRQTFLEAVRPAPELAPRVNEEIEAILAETCAGARSAEGYDHARRRVLHILASGDLCRREDLSILDELERRARQARLTVKH
jgi:hypothetical protein